MTGPGIASEWEHCFCQSVALPDPETGKPFATRVCCFCGAVETMPVRHLVGEHGPFGSDRDEPENVIIFPHEPQSPECEETDTCD